MTIPKTTTMLGASSASANRPSRVRALQLVDRLRGSASTVRAEAPLAMGLVYGAPAVNAEAAAFSASCGLFLPSNAFWIWTWSACEAAL